MSRRGMMTVIFLGDVVGEPGRLALYRALPGLRAEFGADAVVVNGENAAGGKGITPRIAREFLAAGVDVVTLGDHVWDQSELAPWLAAENPPVLRPFNLQADTPGCGSLLLPTPAGMLGVLCLEGRTFMRPAADNPFPRAQEEARRLREAGADALLVDFHAETTSEKIAMGYHLDGIASAVIGTHTHVQTADARILPGGTACMTDAGMCGPRDGVIGRESEPVLRSFVSCMPFKLPVAGWPVLLCGAVIRIDSATGRACDITPLNRLLEKNDGI